MAIKLIGTKKLPKVIGDGSCEVLTAKEFLCDTDADFASLPECCVSSSAVSIESGIVKVVNTEGEWVPFASSGNGGGGGSAGTAALAYHVYGVDKLPADANDGSLAIVTEPVNGWHRKDWDGAVSGVDGQYVWTDGTNIYWSNFDTHYVLNGDTWEPKTWAGMSYFGGNGVWSDGTNVYYNDYGYSMVLNKETGAWEPKEWSGLETWVIAPGCLWFHRDNVYYACGSAHFVLNKSTGAWEHISWPTIAEGFYGSGVWHSLTDTYCTINTTISGASNSEITSKTYVLTDGGWVITNMNCVFGGSHALDGTCVWTDGSNTYYSGATHIGPYISALSYVLNGDTWEEMSWPGGFAPSYGSTVWKHNGEIYCSLGEYSYVLSEFDQPNVYALEDGEWTKVAEVKKLFGGSGGGGTDDNIVGTWVFNDEIEMSFLSSSLDFLSGGKTCVGIATYGKLDYSYDDGTTHSVYTSDGGWVDEAFKTIEIVDDSNAYEAFIPWLKANATKVG